MDRASFQVPLYNNRAAGAARQLRNVGDASAARRKQAAEDFEAIFVEYMLRQMRQAQVQGGLFGSGAAGDFYESLLESAVAKQIAHHQQLGLAKMILQQLERETPKVEAKAGPATTGSTAAGAKTTLPKQQLSHIVQKAAAASGVDALLLQAMIVHESGGNPQAVSPKGAVGLMQLMPETGKEIGVRDLFDPIENVYGGARYMARLLSQFHGDTKLALAAYNAGPEAVERYGGVPPYEETQRYVARVIETWRSFAKEGS